MKKILILLISILLVPFVTAQQTTDDAGVTPDSFLWGLDKAIDQLALLLTLETTDKEAILSEIASKLGVTVEQIRDIVEFEVKEKEVKKKEVKEEAEEEIEVEEKEDKEASDDVKKELEKEKESEDDKIGDKEEESKGKNSGKG